MDLSSLYRRTRSILLQQWRTFRQQQQQQQQQPSMRDTKYHQLVSDKNCDEPSLRADGSFSLDIDYDSRSPRDGKKRSGPKFVFEQELHASYIPQPEPSLRCRVSYAAAMVLLLAIYCYCYSSALVGGDLWSMKDRLTMIGINIVVAVLTWTTAFWIANTAPMRLWERRVARAAVLLLPVLWYCYDHGERFEEHGWYNFLIFSVIALPLNLIVSGCVLWYKALGSAKRFWASFSLSALSVMLAITVTLLIYQRVWFNGYLGLKMRHGCKGPNCRPDEVPECNYISNLPFVDLLPAGTQNFWTGAFLKCRKVKSFDAEFTDGGLLYIRRCKSKVQQYTMYPDSRGWNATQKHMTFDTLNLQNTVLANLVTRDYTGPVRLPGVEAVTARCGAEEKLLVRVETRDARTSPPVASRQGPAAEEEKLNVLMLFFDATSRRHFHRRLPRTGRALEKLHNSGRTRMYEFFRYHSVGFHTGPNSRGFYTGAHEEDYEKRTYDTPIWMTARNRGYMTGRTDAHCEDWGTEYDRQAIPQIDHELISPFCDPEYTPHEEDGHKTFQGAYSITRRCLRGREVHNYNFDYINSWTRVYRARPWFLSTTFLEAHEGTGEVLRMVDPRFSDWVSDLSDEVLNSTAIFIMADHGLHMGLNFVYATNGAVEHMNPMLTMLLPPWMAAKYPDIDKQMRSNTQKLVTAYDIFATFNHLLYWNRTNLVGPADYQKWAADNNYNSQHISWGKSLLGPIPASRDCAAVNISAEYCKCY